MQIFIGTNSAVYKSILRNASKSELCKAGEILKLQLFELEKTREQITLIFKVEEILSFAREEYRKRFSKLQ